MLPILGRFASGVKKASGAKKKVAAVKASTKIKNLQQAGTQIVKDTNLVFMQDYLNNGVTPTVKPPGIFTQVVEKGKDFVEDVAATGIATGDAFKTNTTKLAEGLEEEAKQVAEENKKPEGKAIPTPILGGMVDIKKPVSMLKNAGGIVLLLSILLFIHFAVVTVKVGENGERYTRFNLLLKTLTLKTNIVDVQNPNKEIEGTRTSIGTTDFYETENGNVKMDSGYTFIDAPLNGLSGFGQTVASPLVDGVSNWILGGVR